MELLIERDTYRRNLSLHRKISLMLYFALLQLFLLYLPEICAETSHVSSTIAHSLPGSPSACYAVSLTNSLTITDSCGGHKAVILGTNYKLSAQGVTWNGAGSQIRTDIRTLPKSILACFTHDFGGARYGDDVTKVFEKYPSLLTADSTKESGAISLEGQDGRQQGRNLANLGYLYFTEADSGQSKYIAATKDGTNGGPHCLIVDRTQSGGDKFYLDGTLMSMDYNASSGNGTLGGGSLVIGGRIDDPDHWFHGTLHLLVLWKTEVFVSQAAVNGAMLWADEELKLRGLPPAGSRPTTANDLKSRFVIVGDSITECAGVARNSDCWARKIKLDNPAIESIPIAMGGLSGQFDAITAPGREATLIDPRATFNVAQFYFGVNDGCRNQFSEDQVWQRAVQWSRYMHSLGVRTLFTTMLDIGNTGGCGPHNESGATFKKRLNAIARTNYRGAFNGIVDFASDPEFGADGASEGKCFQIDHVHPNATCQSKMTQMTEDSVNYVLDTGPVYVSTPVFAMNGGDREVVVAPKIDRDIMIKLPSCLGKTSMPYMIVNGLPPSSAHVTTLVPISGESIFGQTDYKIEIPAGTSLTLTSIVPDPVTAGCTWVRI